MNLLKIRLLAKEDIQEIVNYYDKINPKVTTNFLKDLFIEIDNVVKNPLLFSVKYKKTRVRYMKCFSYGIHYIIIDKTIHVLAIIHTSRNPKTWKGR